MGSSAKTKKDSYSKSSLLFMHKHTHSLITMQIPAVLSEELRYSPYLQTNKTSVKDLVGLPHQASEDKVLAELRHRKNMYKPVI